MNIKFIIQNVQCYVLPFSLNEYEKGRDGADSFMRNDLTVRRFNNAIHPCFIFRKDSVPPKETRKSSVFYNLPTFDHLTEQEVCTLKQEGIDFVS